MQNLSSYELKQFGLEYKNQANFDNDLSKALNAFKKADAIKISSFISNQEAILLREIAKSLSIDIISPECFGLSKFVKSYALVKELWEGKLDDIATAKSVIIFGTKILDDTPIVKEYLKGANIYYMHPIEDSSLNCKKFIKYEAGSEEGVAAMLLELFSKNINLPNSVEEFIDELDIGYISAEASISEEELEELLLEIKDLKSTILIVGSDIFNHERVENIAKIVALIEKLTDIKVLVLPNGANSLVASLIVTNSSRDGFTIGYRVKGDFTISSIGDRDFNIPALSQQDIVVTNFNKEAKKIEKLDNNYSGYTLEDIASELKVNIENLSGLAQNPLLEVSFKANEDVNLQEVEELPSFDGVVVYNVNSNENPNPYTQEILKQKPILRGSKQFAIAAKLQDGDMVKFEIEKKGVSRVFRIDTSLKGTIALNPTFDMGLSAFELSCYRFNKIKIHKVGDANE